MKTRGFTLIELMIVVAIVGILAAVVAPLLFKRDSTNYSAPPSGAEVVRRETTVAPDPSAARCDGGYLMKDGRAVTTEAGVAVKC